MFAVLCSGGVVPAAALLPLQCGSGVPGLGRGGLPAPPLDPGRLARQQPQHGAEADQRPLQARHHTGGLC